MEEVETYPELEQVGNLYTYVDPILESELKPGPVEASMYRRFLKYVELRYTTKRNRTKNARIVLW